MGYTTDFSGQFNVEPKMSTDIAEFINKLSETRRMKRNCDDNLGIDGEFFVDGGGFAGQSREDNILEYNSPPSTQPSLWCKWEVNEDLETIEWDGGEKFYSYTEWLVYLIEKILKPNGYVVNGVVTWSGEDTEDVGRIIVTDNEVVTLQAFSETPQTHFAETSMRTDIVYKPIVKGISTDVKPNIVKVKVTVEVELESYEYDNVSTILEEFSSETDYNFSGTENLTVLETNILDVEHLK